MHFTKEVSPIYHFLKEYARKSGSRLHMPGHKGRVDFYPEPYCSMLPYDITEVQGADALYEAEGIIGQSEAVAAKLYGVKETCFSAGGSTLSIMAMVAVASEFTKKILAVRNSHIAFVNACALTGVEPVWVFPPYDGETGLCLPATAKEISAALDENPDIKAVYLTSPDYYGVTADIEKISEAVHRHGAILLVDNAHGAHLRFGQTDTHPMTLGADLCCDSPHKTLPVLTGGGYFHSNLDISKEDLKAKMALFGSTSPSYLILASLDLCNQYLLEQAKDDFVALAQQVQETETQLRRLGVCLLERRTDVTKITVDCQGFGYEDIAVAARLRKYAIEPEYVGGGKIVLMPSPFNKKADFSRIVSAFRSLPPLPPIPYPDCAFAPKRALEIRKAVFAPSERISVEDSIGRIAAENKVTCPPAIPIVTAGERIGEAEKNLLKNSGILSVKVVK
ncbi:aminotransferase class I/II-fold pyridoxal phosphate-dependent enzyme [Fumia xinanensis]|uniref:Aminotransferase class I/II-fold pyridoxal phosphate-dependent enzyme n=1 Tax=Fumia xinanensis TaxID=2763659 RepID=A0A926E740_9FIRM|nr:aminotransferase class I/II-fold pyridoxal phosphate-dependent enzyme [Fumia xinanensis]MBC8560680.1 aminotransferase class I/II-fold pyridoxal phosphate-dependent enzyme [Fumia xinanensis]